MKVSKTDRYFGRIVLVLAMMILVMAPATMQAFAQSEEGSSLSFDSLVRDRNLPIDVTADALELLQSDSKAMFTGNVEATQGELKLTAQEVALFYNAEAKDDQQPIDQVEANGGVVMTTLKDRVTADRLVYKINEAKIYLLGNVLLSRDGNQLGGETLVIDLITGYSRIEGGTGKGRVKARFNPSGFSK
ncbi:MAG: LptA/OstA family protein [Alphaproteobacteria bacterium]